MTLEEKKFHNVLAELWPVELIAPIRSASPLDFVEEAVLSLPDTATSRVEQNKMQERHRPCADF